MISNRAAAALADAAFKRRLAEWRRGLAQAARTLAAGRAGRGGRHRVGGATRRARSWKQAGRTPALLVKVGGSSGHKAARYDVNKSDAKLLFTNMVDPADVDEWALDAARRPGVRADLCSQHVSISAARGVHLTDDAWRAIAAQFLSEIGADSLAVVTRHCDTKHDHVHITFSKIQQDGGVLPSSHNFYKFRAAVRKVEADLRIEAPACQIADTPAAASDRAVNAQRRAARRCSPANWIDPARVREALLTARSLESLAADLYARGIELKPAVKDGRTTGLLLRQAGSEEWLAGSSISREFSLPKVQAQIEFNRQVLPKQEQARRPQQVPKVVQQQPRPRGG